MTLFAKVNDQRIISSASSLMRTPPSGQKWMRHGNRDDRKHVEGRFVSLTALALVTEPVESIVSIDDEWGLFTGAFAIGMADYVCSVAMHFRNGEDPDNGWKRSPKWPDPVLYARDNASVSGVPHGYIRQHRGNTEGFLSELGDDAPGGFDVAILANGLFDGWREVVSRSRIAVIHNPDRDEIASGVEGYTRQSIGLSLVVLHRGDSYPTMADYLAKNSAAPQQRNDHAESTAEEAE